MKAKELKQTFLAFFEQQQHAIIPSASLIPDNDNTVLFTTAGMQPLTPYLMGQPHPLGKRIANVQKCIRTGDIDDVGDATHTTFFEMLGNWSLGDYFKKDSITWSFLFLTQHLHIPVNRLAVTCFEGDTNSPKDEESAEIWKSLGIPAQRIAFLGKEDNWWGPVGTTGPCGPDTEIFYWKRNDIPAPAIYDPTDNNWVEIWNNVFMQYEKLSDGTLIELKQKNVDTGMGVERVTMALQGKDDVYATELFTPIFEQLTQLSNKAYTQQTQKSFRIIADHMRASVFLLGDERQITPSNTDQGYILRRFIRRTIRHGLLLDLQTSFTHTLAQTIIEMYQDEYPRLAQKKAFIVEQLELEEQKFRKTIEKGIQEFNRVAQKLQEHKQTMISGKTAFLLFQSYGFPLEMIQEIAEEQKLSVDIQGFEQAYETHKQASKKGAEQKFKGGLADDSHMTIKLHTATHILNQALRNVIDKNITQKGSNITPERLRFDFNFDRKLTPEELTAIENEVNRVINLQLDISTYETTPQQAQQQGAQSEFGARYPDKVTVYDVGTYAKEICMGPHVNNTKELGHFKIIKEEASAAGIRRIKAILQ
ncbi:MAG: alanine--tRNA ligase [Candidatus Woesearchaeota archaeon]